MNKLFPVVAIVAAALITSCATAQENGPATASPAQSAPTVQPVPIGSLTAEGRVVPAQHAALSVPNSGIVAEVLVAEGDRVAAGQALLRLDRSRAEAEVAQAEAEVVQAESAYRKLQGSAPAEEIAAAEAELRVAQAQLRQVAGSVTEADRTAAQAQLAQARAHLAELQAGPKRADLQAATAALEQARANLTTQRDSLSAAKTTAQLQLERAGSELTQAQSNYATALQNWQYVQDTGQDPVTPWLGTDPKSGKKIPNRLADAQRQQYYDAFVQSEAAMHSAETAVQQAQVAADTARQAEVSGIQVAEQQLASAQANLDQLRAGADADELAASRAALASSQAGLEKLDGEQQIGALDAAQAAVDQAQAKLERLRAGASESDLAVAAGEVQRAQATLQLAQVAVAQTELRAPFAGTVGALDVRVGEYIAPGTAAVQLADLSTWQIQTTDLTERNIARVRVGGQASVTFDALPDLDLLGTISNIRTLGENKQGDITYTVTIKLNQQDPRLRWNMTAAVLIEQSE